MIDRFAGHQFSQFKSELAELAVDKLTPVAAEMRRLLADPAELDRMLETGADKARAHRRPGDGRGQAHGRLHWATLVPTGG